MSQPNQNETKSPEDKPPETKGAPPAKCENKNWGKACGKPARFLVSVAAPLSNFVDTPMCDGCKSIWENNQLAGFEAKPIKR